MKEDKPVNELEVLNPGATRKEVLPALRKAATAPKPTFIDSLLDREPPEGRQPLFKF